MSGATIANEIRAIAGGLAGKRLDPIQAKDLMIDTSMGAERKSTGKGKVASKAISTRADRVRAEEYHKAWALSLEAKVKEAESLNRPAVKAVKRKANPSRRS